MTKIPTLLIAGTHSGVGKTTITTALMAALRCRGCRVQPFKVGPDFIDPTFHKAATGRPSRNLDGWMLLREVNIAIFERSCLDADVAIVEGVMGLFDGHDGVTDAGSTAEIAKWLNAPVILIVDAAALARSAAAIVRGFEDFDPEVNISGVIFNRVAGRGHFAFLRDALATRCRAACLGFLEPNDEIALPDRHLGLVMAEEVMTEQRLAKMAAWIERNLDIRLLLDLARKGSEGEALSTSSSNESRDELKRQQTNLNLREAAPLTHRPRIGIARDRAFCFYYQDNLDLLESCGAELVEFSPIADARLPTGMDGLYLGGGYPELHASELAANGTMRADIAAFVRAGAPVYAECGGFMYLTEAIIDLEGCSHSMVGIFPTCARMQPRLAAIGYAEVEELDDAGWLHAGERVRGHEFRYSTIDEMPGYLARRYRVRTKGSERDEGYAIGALLGSYLHLHFESCPDFAARFVKACAARASFWSGKRPESAGRGATLLQVDD